MLQFAGFDFLVFENEKDSKILKIHKVKILKLRDNIYEDCSRITKLNSEFEK